MSALGFVPKSTIIRETIDKHRLWIEAQLGVPTSDCLQLRFECHISSVAAAYLLPEIAFARRDDIEQLTLRRLLRSVTLPPYISPAISLCVVRDTSSAFAARSQLYLPTWLDCPIAMRFEDLTGPVIVMKVPYVAGARCGGGWREVVLVRRDCAERFVAMMQAISSGVTEPGIHTYGLGFRKTRLVDWEDLVLDSTTTRLLRQDYESFFRREAWFKSNHLPFRRGYLLHGAPGNGKTSAICAMLSRPGVSGHTLNLSLEHVDDDALSVVFDNAAEFAPSIVVFEDLDRFFNHAHKEKQQTKISLQHLLNCLDGAATREGIIVVATANHPQGLDPAILRRPGRFDRVVAFPPPDMTLRTAFFMRRNVELTPNSIALCAEASSGFSFAQLKESYVLAGQSAFDENRAIAAEDIATAISTLRKSLQELDDKGEGVRGFRCG